MKKLLLLFIMMMSIIGITNAQYNEWNHVPYVDEFERPTGDTASIILCNGSFTNSATYNNKNFTAKINLDTKKETVTISLYEYNRQPGVSMGYQSTFGSIIALVGKDSEKAQIFDNIFAPKSGGIFITKKDNPELYNSIANDVYIYFLINESDFSKYSKSKYKFTFNPK